MYKSNSFKSNEINLAINRLFCVNFTIFNLNDLEHDSRGRDKQNRCPI